MEDNHTDALDCSCCNIDPPATMLTIYLWNAKADNKMNVTGYVFLPMWPSCFVNKVILMQFFLLLLLLLLDFI